MADVAAMDPEGGVGRRKMEEKRQRRGECPKCGIKLFKVGGVLGKKKVPISIQGHVDNGRCLGCYPYQKEPNPLHLSNDAQQNNVPQYLTVNQRDDDAGTVISGITLDHQLIHAAAEVEGKLGGGQVVVEEEDEQEEEETDQFEADPPPMKHPAVSDDDDAAPATALTRGRTVDIDDDCSRPEPPRRASTIVTPAASAPATETTPHRKSGKKKARRRKSEKKEEEEEEAKREIGGTDDEASYVKRLYVAPSKGGKKTKSGGGDSGREIFFDSAAEKGSEEAGKETTETPKDEIVVLPDTLPPDTNQSDHHTSIITPVSPPRRRKPQGGDSMKKVTEDMKKEGNSNTPLKRRKEEFDPERLESLLKSIESTSGQAPEPVTLEAITNLIWEGGKRAKQIFLKCKAYDSLTQIMWAHMVHEPLEERAVALFLATVASEGNTSRRRASDGSDSNLRSSTSSGDSSKNERLEEEAMLSTEAARNATEALLFVMQSLSHNRTIQVTACRALVCLATASGLSKGEVDDGSNSGAAEVVLSAMSAHPNALAVQKWCLRAMYELCTISARAESNKNALLNSTSGGLSAIVECILQSPPLVEAVRLVWCLSANDGAQKTLDPSDSLLPAMVQILGDSLRNPASSSAATLIEALLGSINNLIVTADKNTSGAALAETTNDLACLSLDAAKKYRGCVGLCTEAMALVANIAALSPATSPIVFDKEKFVRAGGVSFVASLIMDDHTDDGNGVAGSQDHSAAEAMHEEAACALLSLALGCGSVKAAIRSPSVFAAVKRMSRLYESSVRWQEILCTLISSVLVTTDASRASVSQGSSNFSSAATCEKDAIGVVCFAMTLHSDAVRVQEACCVALRNVSYHSGETVRGTLIDSDAIDLVVDAIARHHEASKSVVLNGSETLWNVGFSGTQYPQQSQALLTHLLKAMRLHLDDAELLESTLAVILRALVGSDENKRQFCNANGIEVATSVMLIHTTTESLLIKACGLLASLSCLVELVPAVVQAGGVTCTIDVVRSGSDGGGGDPPSSSLLSAAAQFLTNAVLAMPNQCEEVGSLVSVLVDRMRECPEDVEFQTEACRLLWAEASLSETQRSRILSLDGVSVLMATLENNKEHEDLQTNAMEAFNELAMSSH